MQKQVGGSFLGMGDLFVPGQEPVAPSEWIEDSLENPYRFEW